MIEYVYEYSHNKLNRCYKKLYFNNWWLTAKITKIILQFPSILNILTHFVAYPGQYLINWCQFRKYVYLNFSMPVYDAFVLMFFLVRMYYISYAHYYYTNRNSIEIQRQMDILDQLTSNNKKTNSKPKPKINSSTSGTFTNTNNNSISYSSNMNTGINNISQHQYQHSSTLFSNQDIFASSGLFANSHNHLLSPHVSNVPTANNIPTTNRITNLSDHNTSQSSVYHQRSGQSGQSQYQLRTHNKNSSLPIPNQNYRQPHQYPQDQHTSCQYLTAQPEHSNTRMHTQNSASFTNYSLNSNTNTSEKENKTAMSKFASSLGVIMSDDSQDRDSRNTYERRMTDSGNGSTTRNRNSYTRTRQRNNSNNRDNMYNNISTITKPLQSHLYSQPIYTDYQPLPNSPKNQLHQPNPQLQLKIDQLKQQLTKDNHRISQLQQQLSEQHKQHQQERVKLIDQQNQLHKDQMHRLRFNMEENMKSRVDILEWEFEKKANIMKQENQVLKGIVSKYQALLQIQADQQTKPRDRHKEQPGLQSTKSAIQQSQYQQTLQHLQSLQCQLKLQQKTLEHNTTILQLERQNHNLSLCQQSQKAQQQHYNKKRKQIQANTQMQAKYRQIQRQLEEKDKKIEEKIRKFELEREEFGVEKELFQQFKQNSLKMYQRVQEQNKSRMRQIGLQRQRLVKMQQELISKIHIIQAYNNTIKNRNLASNNIADSSVLFQNRDGVIQKMEQQMPKNPSNNKQNRRDSKNKSKGVGLTRQRQSHMNKSELLKLDPHGKININDYLAVLEKGSVEARFGGRAISKLQQFYN